MRISTFIRELESLQRKHGNLDARFVNIGPQQIYNIMDYNIAQDADGTRVVYMGGATIENEYETALGQS